MKILLFLLLVACDDNSSNESATSDYSLKISGIPDEVYRGNKLTISVEIFENDDLVETGVVATSEITLAIKCGDHDIGEAQKEKLTRGKVTFVDILVSGDNFIGQCSATASTKIDDDELSESREFTAKEPKKPPVNTSLPPIKPLPPPPELEIEPVTVGRPIVINVPTTFNDKVKVQPRFVSPGEECRGYFLIYHDGDSIKQLLTGGQAISASNGRLEGLVLIKKANASPTCKGGFVLATTANSYSVATFSDGQATFGGNLSNSGGKLALEWESGTPTEIFFNTASEGAEWTKHKWHYLASCVISRL